MPKITTSSNTATPLIPITMISHGTLTSLDLQKSRHFYEEVLGLEVIQQSTVSLLARKGSDHVYVVVETGEPSTMQMLDHNGLDLPSREAVDRAHEVLCSNSETYDLQRITKPIEQHGSYSFYFADCDGNWWEIVHAQPRGYASLYDDPSRDITARADVDPDSFYHVGNGETALPIDG
jgi:catechol 2,3-dioxygenase-like lactoylglutathione lyase family enzyme